MKKVFTFSGYTDGDVGYDFPKDTKYFKRHDDDDSYYILIEYIFPENKPDELIKILEEINSSIRCRENSKEEFKSILTHLIQELRDSVVIPRYNKEYDFGNQQFELEIHDFVAYNYIRLWMSDNNIKVGDTFSILYDDKHSSKNYFISNHEGYDLYESKTFIKNNDIFLDLLSGNFDIQKEDWANA